ncbi:MULTISPECIES: DNA adenine methylase [unclassified Caulobacter]|uniref:DNA adenine methylase n=1 Tax=unclassified Caulobacter TaxID=2648921 RepID=UPI0006FC94F7|nr:MULTISPECIES: DNA adenine methylase [unclassified Caulobacter]KQV62637.1 DNA adenine methylase [Caulobacter sp. Root342]KQV71770.1 DNA adenine methylase [Caulobacter sp. Root343]
MKEKRPAPSEVPSILKWTGSKRSQAAEIVRLAPPHARYVEPFLGGGAVLYHLAREGAVASDLYAPLIGFWKMAQAEPEALIADYADQWRRLQEDLPGYFYAVRDRFNAEKRPADLNFLMRTCVNGIVRFSRDGDFNNSFHLSRRGMLPGSFAKAVQAWSARLRGVEFVARDYRETLAETRAGDFVYLDPPYAGNKQRYIGGIDEAALFAALDDLNRRGVRWALSFDGRRGETVYRAEVPEALYRRRTALVSGYSAVAKVLNGPVETVSEALYLSW